MSIYGFGGKFQLSYTMGEIDKNRAELCYTDNNSLCALERLVSGGITSTKDLWACEIALKGLVFHDKVDLLQPTVQRCQPWRAKRRLVNLGSREAALLTRRAHSARGEAK